MALAGHWQWHHWQGWCLRVAGGRLGLTAADPAAGEPATVRMKISARSGASSANRSAASLADTP